MNRLARCAQGTSDPREVSRVPPCAYCLPASTWSLGCGPQSEVLGRSSSSTGHVLETQTLGPTADLLSPQLRNGASVVWQALQGTPENSDPPSPYRCSHSVHGLGPG